jgi:hypothetical protein
MMPSSSPEKFQCIAVARSTYGALTMRSNIGCISASRPPASRVRRTWFIRDGPTLRDLNPTDASGS